MAKPNILRKNHTSELANLRSVGPAMLRDFERLGIHTLPQLRRFKAEQLYEKLCRMTGRRHDPCVLDVFSCAIAQAKNPNLPQKQRDWWYWSAIRKWKGKHRKGSK